MYRRTFIFIYVALFILTWTDFTVMGLPKTRFQQCKERGFITTCKYESYRYPCEILKCAKHNEKGAIVLYNVLPRGGVPDQTECGQSKICKNKKCVDVDGPMPRYFGKSVFSECSVLRILPYQPVPTRQEQCKNHGFDVACKRSDGMDYECRRLDCGYETIPGSYIQNTRTQTLIQLYPIPGSRCGDNKICYQRKCVSASCTARRHTGEEIFHECQKSSPMPQTTELEGL